MSVPLPLYFATKNKKGEGVEGLPLLSWDSLQSLKVRSDLQGRKVVADDREEDCPYRTDSTPGSDRPQHIVINFIN